jgi:DNA adenine methylase
MVLEPILKYAGGKRALVPNIRAHWERALNSDPQLRLVEPFVGGLSVALGISPDRALLNDVNPHVIDLYQSIAAGAFNDFCGEDSPDKALYDIWREAFNHLVANSTPESCNARSQLLYMLNRSCFNGLMRFNLKGEFNVPFGKYEKIKLLTPQQFCDYAARLVAWEFVCGDFANLQLGEHDFLYLDPPYDSEDDKGFTSYFGQFSWDDRVRMAHWAKDANLPTIISDLSTARTMQLYADCGFTLTTVTAKRSISANGDRGRVIEIFAFKNMPGQ